MIRRLLECQVADPQRGMFFVRVEATNQRIGKHWVYVSQKGTEQEIRFTIEGKHAITR